VITVDTVGGPWALITGDELDVLRTVLAIFLREHPKSSARTCAVLRKFTNPSELEKAEHSRGDLRGNSRRPPGTCDNCMRGSSPCPEHRGEAAGFISLTDVVRYLGCSRKTAENYARQSDCPIVDGRYQVPVGLVDDWNKQYARNKRPRKV